MAFKIKDNLDLYGNQLLNFALQADSGFYSSPQIGHMFYYTGAGALANHPVVCVNPNDTSGNKFKALAFVDEIATNEAFTELAGKVETIEKALGEDTANVIDTWEEIQNFLKNINENDADLMTLLDDKLSKSKSGTITSASFIPLTLNSTNETQCRLAITIKGADKALFGWHNEHGTWIYNTPSASYIGIKNNDGTPFYGTSNYQYTLLHSGNIGEYNAGSADKLQTARTLWGQEFDGTGNVSGNLVLGYNSIRGAGNENALLLSADALTLAYSYRTKTTSIYGGSIKFEREGSLSMLINSSGNVTIGSSDLYGIVNAKLHVDGRVGLKNMMLVHNSDTIADSGAFLLQYYTGGSDKLLSLTARNASLGLKYNILAANWESGNVFIGTTTDNGSGAKLQVKGDLYVDGNIIATKEVSAGGAGQEGESGDGGAEVLAQQLAKGQSTYTITNTIGRSDIAVSLYEWNANNESWDMCLADISVKDATITVTFGSATSVNHKIVAVG